VTRLHLSLRTLAEGPSMPDARQGYASGTYDPWTCRIEPHFSDMNDILLSRMETRAPCPPSGTHPHVYHPDGSSLTLRDPNFIAYKTRRFTLVKKRRLLDVVRQLQMTNPAAHGKYNRKRACYMCLETVCVPYLYKGYTLYN